MACRSAWSRSACREFEGAAHGRAALQAPCHVARGRPADREFGGSALRWCAAGRARSARRRALRFRAPRACSAIHLSDASLRGTIMKYGALVICATFALLGFSAPAFADAPAGSNLQAGGLKPPDAVESDP